MMSILRTALALLLVTPALLRAGDESPVKIEKAWVRAVPPSISDTAAFMRIRNTGGVALQLTGGNSPIAGMAMPMCTTRTTVQGSVLLGMKPAETIEIPAHGEHVLKPGGDHLMLMNLKAHPHPGDKVSVTLMFEPGHRKVTLLVPARLDAEE